MRSRLQCAGHVERMADDRLPKRAAEVREQGRRRRGRPRLRWEDCVKRDVRKAGEEVSNLSPTTPTHTCNYNINILVGLWQRFIQQRWSGNPKLARTIPFI